MENVLRKRMKAADNGADDDLKNTWIAAYLEAEYL